MATEFVFKKNSTEFLKGELTRFQGEDYVNLRCWYEDPAGQLRPTKKGVTFKAHSLDRIIEGLSGIRDACFGDVSEDAEAGSMDPESE